MAILILNFFNVFSFELNFILFLIPFGATATIMAFLRNLYDKNTPRYALIGFGLALYRGLYFFYLFGGFFTIQQFGTYSIDALGFQIDFYIQIIALLLVLASLLNSVYYIQLYREVKTAPNSKIADSSGKEVSSI
ncbi:MAG: hypothetical protein HWN65_20910 [Candidatus Helarchaeota archaeon]|nr:hypothetical protein [Candidatus Helarchaeota archaeon]